MQSGCSYTCLRLYGRRALATPTLAERSWRRCFITREADGSVENVEVTGVDFYKTVETLAPMQAIYGAARKKLFDIYDVGGKATFFFVEILRSCAWRSFAHVFDLGACRFIGSIMAVVYRRRLTI